MVRRYFNVDEAEKLLPNLIPLLQRAQELKRRLEQYERIALRQEIMTDGSRADVSGLDEVYDSQLHQLKELFYTTIEKIEHYGCVVKNVDQGLIQFYTRFEGRDVCLSWRLGEKKIRFWHEEGEDATGRKPILEL